MIPIKIIIADDHPIFREGLTTMLNRQEEIELIGEASSGLEVLSLMEKQLPDVIIMDILMPGLNGIETTKRIRDLYPAVEVLALSMSEQETSITGMLAAGARGYLLKNAGKEEVLNAIKTAAMHKPYFCEGSSKKLSRITRTGRTARQTDQTIRFTAEEIEVIKCISRGLTNKEIAHLLRMRKRTVEGWRSRIMRKLDVKGAAGIVVYALKENLFTQEEKLRYKIGS